CRGHPAARAGRSQRPVGLYLVIGWIVGGYLVAAIVGISAGSRPETLNRATIRFGARALRDRHRPGRALIVGPWGPWLSACPPARSGCGGSARRSSSRPERLP